MYIVFVSRVRNCKIYHKPRCEGFKIQTFQKLATFYLKAPQPRPNFWQRTWEARSCQPVNSIPLPVLKPPILWLPLLWIGGKWSIEVEVWFGAVRERKCRDLKCVFLGFFFLAHLRIVRWQYTHRVFVQSVPATRCPHTRSDCSCGVCLPPYWLLVFRSLLNLFFWYQPESHLLSLHSHIQVPHN